MHIGFLSNADWLHENRVLTYARFLCGVYAVAAILWIGLSPELVDPSNKPIGTDFISFWTAGKLALSGDAADAYDYSRHSEAQRQALRWRSGQAIEYFPWPYPPTFFLISSLLAFLPYGLALALWMATTLAGYLATVRWVFPSPRWLLLALSFPAAFVNLGHGQNGFLSVILMGGGLALLDRNPYLAGILMGLLSYKPQLGLLLPLVLVVSHRWKTILSAAATTIVMAALSYGIFGAETWQAFLKSLSITRGSLELGAVGWEKLQSVFAAVRMVGGVTHVAYAVHVIVALSVTGIAVWVWHKPVSMRLKGAILVTASVLATPYLFDYDLILLALPLAWLAVEARETRFLPWEKIGIFMVCLLPFISRPFGTLGIPISPFVLMLFFGLVLRRVRQTGGISDRKGSLGRTSSVETVSTIS